MTRMKHVVVSALFAASAAFMTACSGDEETVQEPIAPDAEGGTGYSEDPEMSPPAGEEQPAPDATATDDTTGELSNDPFGAPPADAPPADDAGTADDYAKSFDNDTPEPDAAPDDQPAAKTAPVIPDTEETADTGDVGGGMDAGGSSGSHYVDALLLNVRSGPSARSPIVRRLLGGAKVDIVDTKGRYSKIKSGQWVASKHLSSEPTRKVTRAEVAKAWKKSRYKDTWKPGK